MSCLSLFSPKGRQTFTFTKLLECSKCLINDHRLQTNVPERVVTLDIFCTRELGPLDWGVCESEKKKTFPLAAIVHVHRSVTFQSLFIRGRDHT